VGRRAVIVVEFHPELIRNQRFHQSPLNHARLPQHIDPGDFHAMRELITLPPDPG
jgi:hypothetical protein